VFDLQTSQLGPYKLTAESHELGLVSSGYYYLLLTWHAHSQAIWAHWKGANNNDSEQDYFIHISIIYISSIVKYITVLYTEMIVCHNSTSI
jgi:hypothetical protein